MALDEVAPSTLIISTAIVLFLSWTFTQLWPSIRLHFFLRSFPRSGLDPGLFGLGTAAAKRQFFAQGEKLVEEGYEKYKDQPFVIQTSDLPRIVIPYKYVDETWDWADTKLSHKIALLERFFGPYTGMDAVRFTSTHRDVCKVQLTSNLAPLLPHMKEELDRYLSGRLGEKDPSVNAGTFQLVLEAISHITSRVLLDDVAICRSSTWLDGLLQYPGNVSAVAMALRTRPAYVRPIIYPFLQATKNLRAGMASIQKTVDPIIAQRRADASSEKTKKPLDVLQFVLDADPHAPNEQVVGYIFFLVIAAIHTSTFTATQALYDLCAMPDVQAALREEVEDTLKETGGEWTLAGLRRLRQMDSFLKESHRMNSPGVLNYNRLLRKDISLRDGTVLPAGAMVSMAGAARSKDPALYSSPHEFQAKRFYNTNASNDKERGLFSSTAAGDSWFGHGPQACPGRWYADVQIKLLLATLLVTYDLTFPDGQTKRPDDYKADEKILPDMKQEIVLRRR
ncbi:hypothetical protein PISL3812_09126 [Talaromyces islandicus]|uniref:Ent-kaurene oxidase n=1 Tax=Talaromyces islandicus TaxID=28573 RepID=A0A0U1MAH4_TALIS|nr:hypothetical protein PISL3812_09126 [Talaromyces islandicus]